MQQLNEAENTLLGITSGIIEVSVMQSTNYLKNASQQGLPFTLNPRVLYRGYVANCLNMGSVTGFQFFANGATKQLLTGGVTRPLTPAATRARPVTAVATSRHSSRGVIVRFFLLSVFQCRTERVSVMGLGCQEVQLVSMSVGLSECVVGA